MLGDAVRLCNGPTAAWHPGTLELLQKRFGAVAFFHSRTIPVSPECNETVIERGPSEA